MPTITLPRDSIMYWGKRNDSALKKLTEHNRQSLNVSWEAIETSDRMIDGTLRKWQVTRKRSWSVSWNGVPHDSARCVDGAMGGDAMEKFYLANPAEFSMEIRKFDGTKERVLVMFTSFEKTILKRGVYELWDVSCAIEEV